MTYVPSLTPGTVRAAQGAAERSGNRVTLSSIDTSETVTILPDGRVIER